MRKLVKYKVVKELPGIELGTVVEAQTSTAMDILIGESIISIEDALIDNFIEEVKADSQIDTLDKAIGSFRQWCEGEEGFDELDLKEYLYDAWLPAKFIERSRIKNGWNQKGEKL